MMKTLLIRLEHFAALFCDGNFENMLMKYFHMINLEQQSYFYRELQELSVRLTMVVTKLFQQINE